MTGRSALTAAVSGFLLCVGLLAGISAAETVGEPDSLGTALNRPDPPEILQATRRMIGWDIRTRHFIIFCTTTREDGQWVAQQAEKAFADARQLGAHWTETRMPPPRFRKQAIGIMVTDHPLQRRAAGSPGPPRVDDYGSDVYIRLGRREAAGVRRHLPQLRVGTFYTMLRASGQSQLLPNWVQEGLAKYISGDTPPKAAARGWIGSDLATDDARQAALLVQYLVEGDDARHAADLLASMAATVAQYPHGPFSPIGWDESLMRMARPRLKPKQYPLEELIARPDIQRGFTQWLAGPEQEQPTEQPTVPPKRQLLPKQIEMETKAEAEAETETKTETETEAESG